MCLCLFFDISVRFSAQFDSIECITREKNHYYQTEIVRASYLMFGAITASSKRVEPINREKYGTINKINLKYTIKRQSARKRGREKDRKTKRFFIGILKESDKCDNDTISREKNRTRFVCIRRYYRSG